MHQSLANFLPVKSKRMQKLFGFLIDSVLDRGRVPRICENKELWINKSRNNSLNFFSKISMKFSLLLFKQLDYNEKQQL